MRESFLGGGGGGRENLYPTPPTLPHFKTPSNDAGLSFVPTKGVYPSNMVELEGVGTSM